MDEEIYRRPPPLGVRALRFREQLEAGPGAVNLRERCPFYYEVCVSAGVCWNQVGRQAGKQADKKKHERIQRLAPRLR